MNNPPSSREDVALGVLAGLESAEQAAQRLGVPVDEILGWCRLIEQGAALGKPPSSASWRAVAAGGFALLLVASTWARVALAAPCNAPSGWPASGMTAFCPETPVLATPINENFAYLAGAIKNKFSPFNADLNLPAGGWVSSKHIGAKQINSTHLIPNLFSSLSFTDGIVTGADFAGGSIQTDKLKQSKLYSRNVACRTTPRFTSAATCISGKTNDACPPGLSAYYVCGSASNKTGCQASPPAACSNTLFGSHVSP